MPELKYDVARSELLPFVPPTAQRLLDIGCGVGRYGADVAHARPDIELWAVEPDADHAAVAAPHFHRLVEDVFPDALSALPAGYFDVVTFNDVLEHLVEPGEALDAARGLLRHGGAVVASIPNVRHRCVIVPLLLRGRWDYEEVGLLDRTHLRFFTKQTMQELFRDRGWEVLSVVGINRWWHWQHGNEGRKLRWVRRVFGSTLDDFFFVQYVVTARPTATA